jgi:hypothetical protein
MYRETKKLDVFKKYFIVFVFCLILFVVKILKSHDCFLKSEKVKFLILSDKN